MERKALAIKWALDSFKYYLLGREFTVTTGHALLLWLQWIKDPNSRLTRWYLEVQSYKLDIKHRMLTLISSPIRWRRPLGEEGV